LRDDPTYTLDMFSSRTLTIADNDSLHVNFQKASNTLPTGYVGDFGDAFGDRGNGLSYGWNGDNTANARIPRSAGSPDFRYDTFNHMQKNGANRQWEISLPNGTYEVRLVAGDPNGTDSVYKMNLEGSRALTGTPSGDTHWFRSTSIVNVTDG